MHLLHGYRSCSYQNSLNSLCIQEWVQTHDYHFQSRNLPSIIYKTHLAGQMIFIIKCFIWGFCQETTAFQCYDGSCIPRAKLCDNTVDCPGLLREDELNCVEGHIASCKDWRLKGYIENKRYTISPGGLRK